MSNEPITRKEMFMAKASGQNVNTPKPITREEKFLERIAENGGKATSWKDLGEKTVMGDTLTWDGNTEGLYGADTLGEGVVSHYLISDITPTLEDFANGASAEFVFEGIPLVEEGAFMALANGGLVGLFGVLPLVLVIPTDNFADEENGVFADKKGLYFAGTAIMEVKSLTINGYNGFPRTEITPLPIKYLPDSVPYDTRGIKEYRYEFDGNLEGKEFVTFYDDPFVKVSNEVFPIVLVNDEQHKTYTKVYVESSQVDSHEFVNDTNLNIGALRFLPIVDEKLYTLEGGEYSVAIIALEDVDDNDGTHFTKGVYLTADTWGEYTSKLFVGVKYGEVHLPSGGLCIVELVDGGYTPTFAEIEKAFFDGRNIVLKRGAKWVPFTEFHTHSNNRDALNVIISADGCSIFADGGVYDDQ